MNREQGGGVPDNGAQTGLPFTYQEFSEWYEIERERLFTPAMETLERLIKQLLSAELSDMERARIRISSRRVKNANRVWTKLTSRAAEGRNLSSLGEVPQMIDDLVGLRITCNNLSDIRRVQELIGTLPTVDDNDDTATLVTDPESEREYHSHPKATGYRAYHINLHTLVPAHSRWERVTGELQVRTLLQDGWGELTHEDTYKPGIGMPVLANTIARRMADLLATVDDLAQDLRDELDRLASDIATEERDLALGEFTEPLTDASLGAGVAEVSAPVAPLLPEVLMDETRRIVESLSRPATLASIAGRLRGEFGSEITANWGGFGSFKLLLAEAVPSARLVTERPPGYVIPEGVDFEPEIALHSGELEIVPDGCPEPIVKLRRYERAVPLVSAADMQSVIATIAVQLDEEYPKYAALGGSNPAIAFTNMISRSVRDSLSKRGLAVPRGQIDYLLKALLFSGNLRPLPAPELARVLAAWLISRCQQRGVIEDLDDARSDIGVWCGIPPESRP